MPMRPQHVSDERSHFGDRTCGVGMKCESAIRGSGWEFRGEISPPPCTLPAPHLTHGPVWIPMRMSAWEPSWGIKTCSDGHRDAPRSAGGNIRMHEFPAEPTSHWGVHNAGGMVGAVMYAHPSPPRPSRTHPGGADHHVLCKRHNPGSTVYGVMSQDDLQRQSQVWEVLLEGWKGGTCSLGFSAELSIGSAGHDLHEASGMWHERRRIDEGSHLPAAFPRRCRPHASPPCPLLPHTLPAPHTSL